MHTYIGPYLECKTSDVEFNAKMRSCTSGTCSLHEKEVHNKDRKFCPQCGSAIGQITYKAKKKNVDTGSLREESNEDLSNISNDSFFSQRSNDQGIDTWIANKKFCDRGCWLDQQSFVSELTPEMIKWETETFKTYFAKSLALFNEKYGEGKVLVKWGVVYYWS